MLKNLAEEKFLGVNEDSTPEKVTKAIRARINAFCNLSDANRQRSSTQAYLSYGHETLVYLCQYIDYFTVDVFRDLKKQDVLVANAIDNMSLVHLEKLSQYIIESEKKEHIAGIKNGLLYYAKYTQLIKSTFRNRKDKVLYIV